MTNTTTQTSTKPPNKNITFQPLNLWQETHCKHCILHDNGCIPRTEAFQRCILAHIALNLEQLRILIQNRTQHLSW